MPISDLPSMPPMQTAGVSDLPAMPSRGLAASALPPMPVRPGQSDLPSVAPQAASDLPPMTTHGQPGEAASTEAELKAKNRVTPEEIQQIAAKHGASAESVRNWTPFLAGAYTVDPDDTGAQGIGRDVFEGVTRGLHTVGEAALGAPEWLAKQALGPKERAALDEVHALAQERRSGLRQLGEFGAELAMGGPVLGAVAGEARGLAAVAKQGAAIGGAQGFFGAKAGDELKSTVTGAVEGAGMGAAFHGLFSGAKALLGAVRGAEPEAEAGLRAALAPVAEAVSAQKASPEFQQGVQQGLEAVSATLAHDVPIQGVDSATGRDVVELAAWLRNPTRVPEPAAKPTEATLDSARAYVRSLNLAPNALRRAYTNRAEAELVQDAAMDWVKQGGGTSTSALFRYGRKLLRGRAQLGIIDDRSQGLTALEPLSDELAKADAAFRTKLTQTVAATRGPRRALQDLGLTSLEPQQLAELEGTADLGKLKWLSQPQREALDAFAGRMEFYRTGLNERAGAEVVAPVEGSSRYIPRMQSDAVGSALAVRQGIRDVEAQAGVRLLGGSLGERELATLDSADSPAWDELKKQLRYLHGSDWADGAELQGQLRKAADPAAAEATMQAKTARSAPSVSMMRASPDEPSLPDSLRETDLSKLEVRWLRQTLQHEHTAPIVQDMQAQVAKLAALNDQAGASYVTRLLQDLSGTNPNSLPKSLTNQAARARTWVADAAAQATQAGDPLAAKAYGFLGGALDAPGVFTSSMYANVVGLKPSTAFKAIMAPWTSTLPEMMGGGGAWGLSRMAAGTGRALQRMLSTSPTDLLKELHTEGWLPGRMDAEVRDAFGQGLRSGVGRRLQGAVESWSHYALLPLSMAEGAGRLIARETARGVAAELTQGAGGKATPEALAFVDRMGAGYAERVRDLIRQGDTAGVSKTLENYVVGKTLHFYTPTQMSELGRDFGRVVSAFGTWPTSVAGDIVRDYVRRGALGGSGSLMRKYLAPLGALWYMQHVASAHGFDPTQSARMRVATGATGLTGASPLPEVARTLKPGESPEAATATQAFAAAATGDPARMWQALNKAGEVFMPFAGMVTLVDTTLAGALADRAKPAKGTTLTARALNLTQPGLGDRVDAQIQNKLKRGGQ